MATLREYFVKDLSRWMNAAKEHTAKLSSGKEIPVPIQVQEDFETCSRFVSTYVPVGLDPVGVVAWIADNIDEVLKIGTGVLVKQGFGKLGFDTTSAELVFTGRIFVYGEEAVAKEQSDAIHEHCRSKNLKLILRGPAYRDERSRFERPQAFICHDSRDKKEVAEPIALGLQNRMCHVWYDEFALGVGAPLRESIERGIKEAKTCIVILSRHFFSNDGWTKAEFDSIYSREIHEKKHLILPVWHGVSKDEVYEYCPRLVDRKGISTDLDMKELVRRLHGAIEGHGKSDE